MSDDNRDNKIEEKSFGKQVIEQWDREIEEEYNHGRLGRIEDKLDDIENEIHEIKNKMLTEGKVFGWIIGIGIFALWGDKIWGFVKGVFLLLTGLFHSGIQGMFTPSEPIQLIIAMILAGVSIIALLLALVFGIAKLIIR